MKGLARETNSAAVAAFSGTDVNVTSEGRPHLGVPIGTSEFRRRYIMEKVKDWSKEVETLTSIANTQPQAAYAALTHMG